MCSGSRQKKIKMSPVFVCDVMCTGNTKNVRIVVMKNLLPSGLELHHKFDLKGSTYGRKASKKEREKAHPTFKVNISKFKSGSWSKIFRSGYYLDIKMCRQFFCKLNTLK